MTTSINKVYLGQLTDKTTYGNEKIWLTKHTWDCGWYWGFGYIGNKDLHFHIESLITAPNPCLASELFFETKLTDVQWWVIRDLFMQAYALKRAAEVYRYGGHQTSAPGITDILKNPEKTAQLNADLEIVLDKVWEYINDTVS